MAKGRVVRGPDLKSSSNGDTSVTREVYRARAHIFPIKVFELSQLRMQCAC